MIRAVVGGRSLLNREERSSGERRLAAAVIAKAVSDIRAHKTAVTPRDRDAARAFLRGGPMLQFWCGVAGISEARVIAEAKRMRRARRKPRAKRKAGCHGLPATPALPAACCLV